MNIPDNYDQFVEHENRRHEELKKLPLCSECDEPITDDTCFEVNGEYICCQCLRDNHLKYTADLID